MREAEKKSAAETEDLLNFCCELGRQLMQNGAEMYRVEESIQRILDAYQCKWSEVFAIPSCIIVNIQEQENHTKAVRVKGAGNDLHKLNELNALCRDICREKPVLKQAWQKLHAIMGEPKYSLLLSYMAYGFAAFFFTLFYGGVLLDAVVAFACGLIVKRTVSYMQEVRANIFFTNLVASYLLAVLPLGLIWAGTPVNLDMVIIGAIMLLVPGIAITNVMRDVLAGDFLTAVTRFAEVLIVAMGITIGVALAIFSMRWLTGWL